jgi:hypothetical protein
MPAHHRNPPFLNSSSLPSALIVIIVLLLRTRSFGVRPVEASEQPL